MQLSVVFSPSAGRPLVTSPLCVLLSVLLINGRCARHFVLLNTRVNVFELLNPPLYIL